jgi:glycosyltransferase involved in cell wall biosynthesis
MIEAAISPGRQAPASAAAWVAARSRGHSAKDSILLHAPSFAFQAQGGGENQLIQTGRHLEDLGLCVRLFCPWTDRLENARLLHLFGMSREGLELARVAKARGVPVLLSPICWYDRRALAALELTFLRKIASLAVLGMRRVAPGLPGWRRELLRTADVILPNSQSEADQLARLFGVPRERLQVIPNGVLPSLGTAGPEMFHRRFGKEPFVLYVGRVEPRKNLLGLILAVRALGLPLVAIGEPPPGRHAYFTQCRREGDGLVRWLGRVDHHDPILSSAYAAAKVFALPSWFETPGLAALEAALAGCPVVITPHGSTKEYFGDLVEYARPDRCAEIRLALARSWESGSNPRLARLVATHYLWPKVAQTTAEVYDQVAR